MLGLWGIARHGGGHHIGNHGINGHYFLGGAGHAYHGGRNGSVAKQQGNFLAGFYLGAGFGNFVVQHHAAAIAQGVGNGATLNEAGDFKKFIQSHGGGLF